MPPAVVGKTTKTGGGRLNAVVNKLHLAKQCTAADGRFPDVVPEQQQQQQQQNHLSLIQNLLSPVVPPPPLSSILEKKNLRAPPALFPLTSEVTIQRYPVVYPASGDRPLDVFQRLKRLGTDIEMEAVRNETTLSVVQPAPSSASVSCVPAGPHGFGRGASQHHNHNNIYCPGGGHQLLQQPSAAAVFNNRKIPEPSVVLEVKVQPDTRKDAQQSRATPFDGRAVAIVPKHYVFAIDQSQVRVTDAGQKLYSCDVCSGVYQRRGALKKHYLKAHINYHYLTSRDLQIAGFKGERLERMMNRWKHATDQIGYYHCHKCYISYDTATELRRHVLGHPPPVQPRKAPGPDAVAKVCELCLYCDKIIENEEDRKAHQSKMHPPKRRSHSCAYCMLNFFDLYTLHKHLCTTHEDVYYGCAECKERFVSRELSKSHRNICLNNLCIKLEADRRENKRFLKEEPPKVEIIELKTDEPKKDISVKKEPVEEPKKESKKKDDSKCGESKKEEPKREEIKREEAKREEAKREETKREETKREEAKREEAKREEAKREETKRDETKKKEESKSYPFYCKDCKKGFTQQPNLARHMSLGHGKKLEYKKSNKLLQSNKLHTTIKVVVPKKPLVKIQEKELKDEIQDLSAKGTQYVFLNNKNELVTKQGTPFDISYMNLETQNRIRRMLPPLNPNSSPIEDDMTSLEVEAASSYGFPSTHGMTCYVLSLIFLFKFLLKKNLTKYFCYTDAERKKLVGFSGEWLYPRIYICSACPVMCSNIWDIFYHKWNMHPNVLCHHYDIPLDQLPSEKWVNNSWCLTKLKILYIIANINNVYFIATRKKLK